MVESVKPSRPRRIVDWDLHGWDAIADYLGVAVRTAQRYADEDGLPVWWRKRRVRARKADLDRWDERMSRQNVS
jgi:hypothetical protein